VFKVKGKLSKYNDKFNTLEVFKNDKLLQEFKDYCLQDSIALYETLLEAQFTYVRNYQVDITTILSTST
jgi:hypothetical protein